MLCVCPVLINKLAAARLGSINAYWTYGAGGAGRVEKGLPAKQPREVLDKHLGGARQLCPDRVDLCNLRLCLNMLRVGLIIVDQSQSLATGTSTASTPSAETNPLSLRGMTPMTPYITEQIKLSYSANTPRLA